MNNQELQVLIITKEVIDRPIIITEVITIITIDVYLITGVGTTGVDIITVLFAMRIIIIAFLIVCLVIIFGVHLTDLHV